MSTHLDATAALDAMLGHEAWAAIRLRDSGTVTLVGGSRSELERLVDVPLEEGVPADGRRFDRLVAIPFRQVAERGFEAHDDGTPLTVVDIDSEAEVPLADLVAALPREDIGFLDRGGFDTSDEEYGVVVDAIIRDEIGHGEGANLVVGRHYRAQVEDWGAGQGPDRVRPAARAGARRLLDLRLLHRRPVPRRRQPRAARLGAG